MSNDTQPIADPAPRAISTPTEAEEVFTHLTEVMEALLKLVEDETELVRAGRVSEIARIEPAKTDLARLYMADVTRVKASIVFLRERQPKLLAALQKRHDTFNAQLQVNLTVLATARAVSESIMRGVSQELSRKTAPQVYGASGQQATPAPGRGQPLAMSRSL